MSTSACSGVKVWRPLAVALGVVLALSGPAAVAQSEPLREGPIIDPPQVTIDPGPVVQQPPPVQALVQVFLDACVLNEGQTNDAVDWALAKGFEPVDPSRAGAENLLDGVPGNVLEMPGSGGHVLLVVALNRRCLVWAEQTSGPKLRIAFQKMVSDLGSKGARVQSVIDRNLNSAGTWRNQLQWRYRRVGGSEDFGLGSATTLAGAPNSQLLHFAPMARPAPRYPDGMPSR